MTWTPLAEEPQPLALAITDAVRAAVMPAGAIGSVRAGEDGVLVVERPDAPLVRAVFRQVDSEAVTIDRRDVYRLRLEGRAVAAGRSLVLAATAILDRATGAFLDVSYSVLSDRAVANDA
jgi:hypothetical protein